MNFGHESFSLTIGVLCTKLNKPRESLMDAVDLSLSAINPAVKQQIPLEQQALLIIPPTPTTEIRKEPLKGDLDGFVLFDVLSPEECQYLTSTTEKINQYSFWSPETRKDFRDADTIECTQNELAQNLWTRMSPFIQPEFVIGPDHKYFEKELEGEWVATGINPNLLFGRYISGGHFAPHTDGCTVLDFNYRTLYSVIIYLNECKGGGRTHLMKEEQLQDMKLNSKGAYYGDEKYIIDSALPIRGSALVFYHAHVHEGEAVDEGAAKYFIRTDVLYKRKNPICTSPTDVEAFGIYNQAKEISLDQPMEAMKLFRRAFKMSPTLAEIFGQ